MVLYNVPYGSNHRQIMDILLCKESETHAIVYIHGGAYRLIGIDPKSGIGLFSQAVCLLNVFRALICFHDHAPCCVETAVR